MIYLAHVMFHTTTQNYTSRDVSMEYRPSTSAMQELGYIYLPGLDPSDGWLVYQYSS